MRRHRGWALLAGLAAAALTGGLSACSSSASEGAPRTPASPAPVALEQANVPDDVTIGVVVSLTSAPDEGSDWSQAAEGARVAAYRYGQADVSVTLKPVDDKGTAKGAAAAVRHLASEGVSGIVLATEGDHVRAAVAAADDAGVPVLLPYATDPAVLHDLAWATGPDEHQVAAGLASSLRAQGLRRPVLVDAGTGKPAGIHAVASYRLRAGSDPARLAGTIAKQTRSHRADSVLVSGPAQLQAGMVQALQGADVDLPVLLTPDALSPVFATTLTDEDGTLAGRFTTVGTDAGDIAAMDADGAGQALSAYFAALRSAVQDGTVKDFFDDQAFDTVSDAADTRSHDAVVALVTAAAKAGSAAPDKVAEALSGLEVTRADGLAGPSLDFGSHSAVSDDDVVALQGTPQGPGLRPTVGTPEPQLYWFTAPDN